MTFFLKFHIFLASTNKTTIENLDKKGKTYKSPYDIGPVNNWHQIFGTNKLLWPLPVFCGSGKPLGDGIYWPMQQKDEDNYSSYQGKESQQSPNKKGVSPSREGGDTAMKMGISPGHPQYQSQQISYRTSKSSLIPTIAILIIFSRL
jgi:hypothetical protein